MGVVSVHVYYSAWVPRDLWSRGRTLVIHNHIANTVPNTDYMN